MINEKIQDSVEEKREHLIYQYSARGVPTEILDDYRVSISLSDEIFELSFYESLVWYSCLFDSFDRNDLLNRFIKSYCKVNGGYCIDYRKHFNKAFERLTKDNLLCKGQAGNRLDSIFDMFASSNIRLVINSDNAKYGYSNGIIINPEVLDYEYAVQTPKKTLPITKEEKDFMDMLEAENWNIAEISRNFLEGFSSDTKRKEVSHEITGNLTEMEYIRKQYGDIPFSKVITLIALALLRKHRIILF